MDIYLFGIPLFWIVLGLIFIALVVSLVGVWLLLKGFDDCFTKCPYYKKEKQTSSCKIMKNKYCAELHCKYADKVE